MRPNKSGLGENRLPVLAAEIRAAHDGVEAAAQTMAARAIEAGRLLIEAKELCGHGEWLTFLESAGVHERKAQRYMQLFKFGLKSDTVSDLGGIKAALRWIDRLHLPASNEFLLVGFGDFCRKDYADRIAIAWITTGGGASFSILNLNPAESWADTLRRPLLRADDLWRVLFGSFDNRCDELEFVTVPKDLDTASAFGVSL